MYKISPYTPLFFKPSSDIGLRSRYIQKFSPDDHIVLQVVASSNDKSPTVNIIDEVYDRTIPISMLSWNINDNEILYFKEIYGLSDGFYHVEVEDEVSEVFEVTKDVFGTILIQTSNSTNRLRKDTVFFIDGMQYFFDFRIPGGFKDDDWSFGVDNEQYSTSDNDTIDIYSYEYTHKTLTIGNSLGCPVWFAEKLNLLLCSTYFYVDGKRYARVDSTVPEMNILIEGLRSYVFKQTLRQVLCLDPVLEERNQMLLRRTGSVNRYVNQQNIRTIK